jgi:hypothetical protein
VLPVVQPGGLQLACCLPLMGCSCSSSVNSKTGSPAAAGAPGSPRAAASHMNQHRMWWLLDQKLPASRLGR